MIRKAIIVMLTLAAVGTAAIGIRSYFGVDPDFQRYGLRKHGFTLQCRTHDMTLGWVFCDGVVDTLYTTRTEPQKQFREHFHEFAGFGYSFALPFGPTGGWVSQGFAVPIWLPFILLAAYPTIAFIRGPLRRYRRRKRGLCVTCGYDLTGSPERCPECGRQS